MKILYIADVRFPIERANGVQTMHTCHALARRGHDVALLVRPDTTVPARDPFAYYGLPHDDRLTIVRAAATGASHARRMRFLREAVVRSVRAPRGAVLLTRDLGVASAVLRIPAWMRPPVVYESHGIGAEFSGALDVMLSTGVSASSTKRRRLDGRERRVWNRADGYITLTRRLSHLLTDRYGPRDRVAAIPDGVSLPSDRRFEPPRFGPHPLVGYAGHLYPWKGVDLLVEALALTPDVRGIIVGGHPAEPDLARVQALAARLGVTRVTFTGLVDPPRVAALLSEADLLVLPNRSTHVSATSTSPLKLFEYLALGKPIVASDLPALREVLRDGDNAVLVEPDSAAALARGLQTVVSDARLAERLARHAFDEAEQYTWERRAERVEALLVQAGAAATR